MAVPNIIRVLPAGTDVGTPSEGPTAGRALVEIWGWNFRLPPPPAESGPTGAVNPYTGIVVSTEPRTVRVKFGTAEAVRVDVVRKNLLRVVTPISPIPQTDPADLEWGIGPVDVTVENLDDNGDPIPGETFTLVDGYTYRRPKLDQASESDFTRLVRTLLRALKLQVLGNTSLTTDTDWDADPDTLDTEIATMPALVLVGPELQENRFYSRNALADERITDDRVEVRRLPYTVDLLFDIVGISNNMVELLNLMAASVAFVTRNPFIEMDRDRADPSKGRVRWEFDFQVGGDFKAIPRPNNSNVKSFSGSVLIRAFDVEGIAGSVADEIQNLTAVVREIDVGIEAYSAEETEG